MVYECESGTKFHYNEKLTGDVVIKTIEGDEIRVSGKDLFMFFFEHLVHNFYSKEK